MFIKDKVVFIDKTSNKEDSFYCKMCNYPLSSLYDFNYHKAHSTCHECYLTFVEARKKEWSEGWRPSKEKIKEYLKTRKQS